MCLGDKAIRINLQSENSILNIIGNVRISVFDKKGETKLYTIFGWQYEQLIYGEILYSNGDSYFGEMKDFVPHGIGMIKYKKEKNTFIGIFK